MRVFSNDFFKQEIKDGFLISPMAKRVRAVQSELLDCVDAVCRKEQIAYYAFSDTLLGAVYYEGYLPWSNETVLAMKRAEAFRFYEALKEELPEGCVLTKPCGDAKHLCRIRLSNSETMCTSPAHLERNWGVPLCGKHRGAFAGFCSEKSGACHDAENRSGNGKADAFACHKRGRESEEF